MEDGTENSAFNNELSVLRDDIARHQNLRSRLADVVAKPVKSAHQK